MKWLSNKFKTGFDVVNRRDRNCVDLVNQISQFDFGSWTYLLITHLSSAHSDFVTLAQLFVQVSLVPQINRLTLVLFTSFAVILMKKIGVPRYPGVA